MIEYTTKGITVNGEEISLEKITEEVQNLRVQENDLVVMTLEWESNRSFDGASERIVLTRENAMDLKEMITGYEVYFGEIAGKHSEIYGPLEEDEITISNNVTEFLVECPSGHDYNHSFLYTIIETCEENEDEDYSFTSKDIRKLMEY